MAAMGSRKEFSLQLTNLLLVLCFFKGVYSFMDMEELKTIYYGLDILNEPVMLDQESPSGSVQVTSRYGQQYQCTFPDHSEAEKKKEEEEKVAVETGIVEMLKPMKSQDCLIKTKDWWTYEFCFGKAVRQYHMEDGVIKGNIIHLGFYDSDFDWSNETAKEERLKTNLASYHSQLYNQGDKCDLTGQPRKVEVRFMCEENSQDTLSRIEESETCVYTMTIITSRVCRHPYLRPPIRRRAVPITCNPLLSEAEYKDYLTEVNERREAAQRYSKDYKDKKNEDLKKRKFSMDKELEETLLNTAKDVLSEPSGSLFPEPGEDGKVTKESFQKMFGSSEQLWQLYQKGLELSKKGVEERDKKMKELKELQKREGVDQTVEKEEVDENQEDEEVISEFSDEIDDMKKRFKRTQKKLSSIKQKLSDERDWEANIEKAIKEAEEELGMKLDRTLVSGLSSTLNKLVNKLQDTENELSSMDEEINGMKPGDKVIGKEGSGQKLDSGNNQATGVTKGKDEESKMKGHDDSGDDDKNNDDEEEEEEKREKVPSTIVKGDGFDKDPGEKWRVEKPEDPTPMTKQSTPNSYDDKIKSPPRSHDDNDMDYSDKKLEVPSTFPLPKDPTQDANPDRDNAPPPENAGDSEEQDQGVDNEQSSRPDFKMSIEELEDTDDENKIPPNIKELLEETVRKEYEKKMVRKGSGKLGLDDDHSFMQDKSIHVIQQEDKDGNTNKFIFVLGFKNMDEEAAEQDRQLEMEENYAFVYNRRNGGSDDGDKMGMTEEEGEGAQGKSEDQPMR